jgi:hypothetical protein
MSRNIYGPSRLNVKECCSHKSGDISISISNYNSSGLGLPTYKTRICHEETLRSIDLCHNVQDLWIVREKQNSLGIQKLLNHLFHLWISGNYGAAI